MNPIFQATITGTIIQHDKPFEFIAHLKSLQGRVEIIVRRLSKKRSNPQNRYYFGIPIKLISDHTGHTTDEIHEILKSMFLKKWVEIKGKEYEIVQSTTELNTLSFEDYLSKIRQWASLDLGLFIPTPDEAEY